MSSSAFDSAQDPSYTYVNDKLTCLSTAFYVHVIFCDLAFAAGVLAMLARLLPPAHKWVHRWFGIFYIICMLFIMGSSLIIHNEGLPLATLVSFVWVLGGLSLGWVVALVHKHFAESEAVRRVEHRVQTDGVARVGLAAMLAEERAAYAASKGFLARIFSAKALHGALMFTSWINIAGRIFASNQSGRFQCYTYPGAQPRERAHGSSDARLADMRALTRRSVLGRPTRSLQVIRPEERRRDRRDAADSRPRFWQAALGQDGAGGLGRRAQRRALPRRDARRHCDGRLCDAQGPREQSGARHAICAGGSGRRARSPCARRCPSLFWHCSPIEHFYRRHVLF